MSDDPARPVPDELLAEMERFAESLGARTDHADLAFTFEWLVDLLVQRGSLLPGHRRLVERLDGQRSSVRLALYQDKRAIAGPDIDCAGRFALCRAACCRLEVSLSAQDVAERVLRWNLHQPYRLSHDTASGHCIYCQADGRCGVYHDRPGTCRSYDCRVDERIWKDFDARIPADGIAELPLPSSAR